MALVIRANSYLTPELKPNQTTFRVFFNNSRIDSICMQPVLRNKTEVRRYI